MPSISYRERKESFVSNIDGSTLIDLIAVTAAIPVAHVFVSCLRKTTSYNRASVRVRTLLEQFVLIGTAIMSTANNGQLRSNLVLSILCCTFMSLRSVFVESGREPELAVSSNGSSADPQPATQQVHDVALKSTARPPQDWLREAISAYRGSIMFMTCFAILAVDFPVFSRQHAKTETYGASLMDLGVGAVVTASAMTSRAARAGEAEDNGRGTRAGVCGSLLPALSQVALPCVLGLVRLVTHSAVDYQHHVSEYGLHWNFYWTIGECTCIRMHD